jgi:ABC-type uncharacterized transport system substrate-binding protein
MGRERPDALFVAATAFFVARRVQLVQLAAFHRIPAAYPLRDFAEAGGLMSYGASIADAYRGVGLYTGRILKGAKPADLAPNRHDTRVDHCTICGRSCANSPMLTILRAAD